MNNATKAVKNPPPCQPQSDSRVLQKKKCCSKCSIKLNYTKFNYCSHIINVEMIVDTLITFHTWIILRRFPQSGRLILEEVSQLSFQSLVKKKHFIVQPHVLHFRALKVYSGFEKLHIENLPTHPLAADHRTTVSLSLRPVKSFSANYYIHKYLLSSNSIKHINYNFHWLARCKSLSTLLNSAKSFKYFVVKRRS